MNQSPVENLETIFVDRLWEKAQNSKNSSLNQLARVCAIPHWFDEEIAQILADTGLDIGVERLATRYPSFVRSSAQGYQYHESIRQAFWRKWHSDDPEKLVELSKRLINYLECKIKEGDACDRLDYEYERMFHLFTVDPKRGFAELDNLFQIAQDHHHIESCHRLVNWVSEHNSYLPENYSLQFNYYKGELARELHQSELAEAIFQELLDNPQLDELTRAKAYNSMALSITSGEANLNKAFPFLLKSIELLKTTNSWYWMGQVLYNLSYVNRLAGRREDALKYGEAALAVLDQHPQPDNITWLVKKSRVLSELGLILWLLGKYDQARAGFNEALTIQLGVEAKDPAIETYANLSRLERTTGNWDEAIQQLQNSIQLAIDTQNQHQMAWTKNALGNLYVEMEQWEQALSCFEESIFIWENIGHQHERGIPLKNLIGVYAALGKWDLAEKAALESMRIFSSHEGRQGEIHNSLGELYLAQMKFDEARQNLERALEISHRNKDRKTEPRVRINLAQLYLVLGHMHLGRQNAELALQQSRDYQQLDRSAQAFLILGKIDLLEGHIDQAVEDFMAACDRASAFNAVFYQIVVERIARAAGAARNSLPEQAWQHFTDQLAKATAEKHAPLSLAVQKWQAEKDTRA